MDTAVNVSVSHFHLNGIDYFRSHANAVQLGDVGEKQMPGDQEPYLAVGASLARGALQIDARRRRSNSTVLPSAAATSARAWRFPASAYSVPAAWRASSKTRRCASSGSAPRRRRWSKPRTASPRCWPN